MSYFVNLQRAISQTQETSSVEVAHKLPSGPTRSYWIGWGDLEKDLLYAMSLGEYCTRGHLDIWTESVVDSDEDVGYYARVKAIQLLMEKM